MDEESDQVTKPSDNKTPGKIRKHTVLETSKGRVYVCKLCNETFDKSYALANHVKSFCPKRALFKKDQPGQSYLASSDTVVGEESILEEAPEIKTSKRLRAAKRQKSSQESTTAPHINIPPTTADTYDNPLRATNPGNTVHLDEYEKSFLPNYPLDLVFKLKSMKALQLALDSALITPEQYATKQVAFLQSVTF